MPLSFIANQGQVDGRVKFLARGSGYGVFLTGTEAVLALRAAARPPASSQTGTSSTRHPDDAGCVLRLRLVGANTPATVEGRDELPGRANYFVGNEPGKWRTNLPTYARVEYHDVYPGVDLVYYGNQGQLEHDFIVAPGADPSRIRLATDGVERPEVDGHGDLVMRAAAGEVLLRRPLVYQDGETGRRQLAASYVLTRTGEVGFRVADYDASRPLVIDPVLSYSTYLGGGGWDYGYHLAIDDSGSAYVTGSTTSYDFPVTSGAAQTGHGGGTSDAFVVRLNATGTALVYSTYLGGSGEDTAMGIAVDSAGNAYVAGITSSSNFPTSPGAFQAALAGGGSDAFVVKLNGTGSSLSYSSFLGGATGYEQAAAVAVDGSGNAHVAGFTQSTDFPVTTGALQTAYGGGTDAFITTVNPTGTALVFSTYLGGAASDQVTAISVDSAGNSYLAGLTRSTNFPTTSGALKTTSLGDLNAFVSKLNATGTALVYSTYLGGSGDETAFGIALDGSGNAYVSGSTRSADFPTTTGAFRTTLSSPGYYDGYVAKLNATGSALLYSTYVGGSADDIGGGVAIDAAGNAYFVGVTYSTDFPTTTGALSTAYAGGDRDAFFSVLNASGSALTYSTYMGGTGTDDAYSVAADAHGNAYVGGWTDSTAFPTTAGAFQTTFAGDADAYVMKFGSPVLPPADLAIAKRGAPTTRTGAKLTYTLVLQNRGPNDATGVSVSDPLPAGLAFQSATPTQGSCTTPAAGSGGTITCSLGTIANASSASVTIVVTVTAATGATLTDTATVSADNPDPNASNNSATLVTSVRR